VIAHGPGGHMGPPLRLGGAAGEKRAGRSILIRPDGAWVMRARIPRPSGEGRPVHFARVAGHLDVQRADCAGCVARGAFEVASSRISSRRP
jgi:hypothetical protein